MLDRNEKKVSSIVDCETKAELTTPIKSVSATNFLVCPDKDNKPRNLPGDRFHHLFEKPLSRELGKARKDRIAVELELDKYTFAELEALANRIGRYLQHNNAKPGDVVAILLDRTIHAYASILAVSKIGCAFVPLDPGFPDSRIEFICKDSSAKFALTMSFTSALFAKSNVKVIALDEAEEEYGKLSSDTPELDVESQIGDPICYTIYTSGTTGNPKGVPICHSSICNFLKVASEEYGFSENDRVYQSLTLAFDYSFEEIWVPLLCGACLVPAPPGVNLLGDDLAQFLTERKITAWCSVPTILATLEVDLPDLRMLIVSGEACPADLVKRWWTPERRFLNLYGPTETTVSATWKILQPGEEVTIGTPLPTYTAMILSLNSPTPVERCEEGEIALAGIGLSKGYCNREAETRKAFIKDIIGIDNNPGGLIYRTGDLGRINKNGEIEYLGRVDTQVKIRGYRIELGEIESVARELSGLKSLVVNPVEVEPGNLELAVYFVVDVSEDEIDISNLHDLLRDRLPPYMVPCYFEKLDTLPLQPSQKVDRKKLPTPSGSRILNSGKAFVEPAAGMEAELAGVLAGVLKIETISADSNFFNDLGANSLIMARFVGGVRKKLGIKTISMKQIYQNTTIQLLATAIAPPQETSAVHSADNREVVGPFNVNKLIEETAGLDITLTNPVSTPTTQAFKPEILKTGTTPAMFEEIPPIKHQDQTTEEVPNSASEPPVTSNFQYVMFAVAQLTWFLIMAFVVGVAGVIAVKWLFAADGFLEIYSRAIIVSLGFFFGSSLFMLAVKWVAIGRFKIGKIPIWSMHHFRFWVAQLAVRANPLNAFVGTPVYNIYLRLVGAKVGKGTLIFAPAPACPDLISIGENSLIRQEVTFTGFTARNGFLHFGTVNIGSNTYISEATTLDINCSIGDNAQLANRSALHEGQQAESGKIHMGSPAIIGDTDFIRVPELEVSPARAWLYTIGPFLYNSLIVGPVVTAGAFLVLHFGFTAASVTPKIASASIISPLNIFWLSLAFYFLSIITALIGTTTMPRFWNLFFRPNEVHKLFSFQYFLAQRINSSSNSQFLQLLFGDSSMIVHYFRAIGYDLTDLKQNGSNFGVAQRHNSPFLCKFSANSLVSDGLVMLNIDMSRTAFKLSPISVPKDAYLGNDLHYPVGAMVGENCLIATKAMIPIDGKMRENVGILGSPPFEIPRSKDKDPRLSHYHQPRILEQRLWLKLKSNLITLAWFMLRNWSVGFISVLAIFWASALFSEQIFNSSIFAGALFGGMGVALFFFRAFYFIVYERIANWYRPMKPRICSLYERPFWDHERFWKLNYNQSLQVFAGSPFKNFISRCQGAKLGKQVFDNGEQHTEPHLVEIGDYCTFNQGSILQCHSLEDGTFKSDIIKVGDRCTFGVAAFVHYGSVIGDDVEVRTDAFVMKGSIISDGETWTGNPAALITTNQNFDNVVMPQPTSPKSHNFKERKVHAI